MTPVGGEDLERIREALQAAGVPLAATPVV